MISPKCPVCGKDCKLHYGKYLKGCCSSHGKSAKILDDEKIKEAFAAYPELPPFYGYCKKLLNDKFGGKIQELEPIVSLNKEMRFYCNDKDPITGEVHGEFLREFSNLIKSPFGCRQCSKDNHSISENIPWKFNFFKRLQELYPNQIKYLHSNGEKFPNIHSKLHFKCLGCNSEFDSSADYLLFHKPSHNKTSTLIACPKCTWSLSLEENRIWNKETCVEEAKKYKSRGEFQKNSHAAYEVARKNNWLDDYTWFSTPEKLYIDPSGNEKVYCIYEYNFSSLGIKAVYVGLTYNLVNRKSSHRCIRITSTGKIRKSSVLKFCEDNDINLTDVENKVLTILEDNLTGVEAQIREDYWKQEREKEGYKILNVAKTGLSTGSLGAAGRKWDLDSAIKELERAVKENPKVNSRSDLEKYYNRPYVIVRKADKSNVNGDSSRLDRIIKSKSPDRYTEETFRNACILAIKSGESKNNKGKAFKRLYYSAYGNGCKKGNKKFQDIFEELFNYKRLDGTENIILQFSDNSRLEIEAIYKTIKEASEKLHVNRGTITDWVMGRIKSRKSFIKYHDWLKLDYNNLLKNNPELAEKLKSQIENEINTNL